MQYSIQYLRAIAAMMVVVFHCYFSIIFMRPDIAYFGWLRSGVDIFFVVSGYVMVTSTTGRPITAAGFAARRAVRIVPLYWFACAIMAGSVLPGEWLYKLGSLLFVPVTHPKSGLIEPIVQPGWTLNYEMFFYALFAVTLKLRAEWRFPAMVGLLATLVSLGTITNAGGIIGFYSNSIILEFALGMAIARFGIVGHWLYIPIGFAILFAVDDVVAPRILTQGIAAAIIVAGFLTIEQRLPRWQSLRLIGDASYAIYLFQILALSLFMAIWPYLGLGRQWFAPLATTTIVAIGIGIHIFVEKPLIALFARKPNGNFPEFNLPAPSPTAP